MEPKKLGRLVLTLRLDETVLVGDKVTVTVVQIKGKQIRLAFTAPKDFSIDREGFRERLQDPDSRGNR